MRLVIKIGTNSISNSKANTINFLMVETLAQAVSQLIDDSHEVILVTSGAVGYGVVKLGETDAKYADKSYAPPMDERPFLASVGQPLLMKCYIDCFAHYNKQVAQILIAGIDDFTDKDAAKTILRTLENKVIPVVNENDSVCDAQIRIGDNDTLSAYAAKHTGADRLIMVTDINGFHMAENGKLGKLVRYIEPGRIDEYMQHAGGAHTTVSKGGMKTKLEAAKIAASAGCITHIIENTEVMNIRKILRGASIGTMIGVSIIKNCEL